MLTPGGAGQSLGVQSVIVSNTSYGSSRGFAWAGGDWGRRMVALAASLGMFLAAADFAVNVALPAITKHFDTDLQTVQWLLVVFIATRAGLALGAGGFADRFGIRPVYLFGASTYLVSMFAIAFSPDLGTAVGFRVLQGLGTGCLLAVSPAVAARVFPVHRRGLSMGFTASSHALGMLAGTIGAGILMQWFGWEVVFLGRAPFAFLALLLALKFMGRERRPESTGDFDVAGALTLIGALLCLVIGLRLGPPAGWTSPGVLTLLPLAAILAAAFWQVEGRAQWPIAPRDLIRANAFIVSVGSMFLSHLGVFIIWFIFPFYISDTLGRGSFTLGIMLAVLAGLNAGFSGLGGWICDRAGTLPVGLLGLIVLAGGLAYMSFLDTGSGLLQVGLRIAVVGIGLGLFQASAYALMLGRVSSDRFGTASAALSLGQAVGSVLSVAVIGGIFGLSEGRHFDGLAGAGLTLAEQEGKAFIQALQDVFRLGALIALAAAVVFLLSWDRKGRRSEDPGGYSEVS